MGILGRWRFIAADAFLSFRELKRISSNGIRQMAEKSHAMMLLMIAWSFLV
jgi:hypothetical protein